ncbi:MAG: hypothetical protein HZA01_02450 [Nitrospinae bacterium]|nr:hypothetical protein [Nitrospinota bacterium]
MKSEIKTAHKARFLGPYKKRLSALVKISRDHGIEPIFITQPVLFGNAIDDVTNVDLGRLKINDSNGRLEWEILELYNDATRELEKEAGVLVIDLAKDLPKSSRYYYDFIHYTYLVSFLLKNFNGASKTPSIKHLTK